VGCLIATIDVTIIAVGDDTVIRNVTGNSHPTTEVRIVLDGRFYMKKALEDGSQTSWVGHRWQFRNVQYLQMPGLITNDNILRRHVLIGPLLR
jgi:hypothetical protein